MVWGPVVSDSLGFFLMKVDSCVFVGSRSAKLPVNSVDALGLQQAGDKLRGWGRRVIFLDSFFLGGPFFKNLEVREQII